MAIMTRLLRLWKADLHGVMDRMEDKGLLLKQYLREMEESLREKQARQQLLSRSLHQLEWDLEHRMQEVEKLELIEICENNLPQNSFFLILFAPHPK